MLTFPMPSGLNAAAIEDAVIDRLPENVFGRNEWATNATRQMTQHLLEAVVSGRINRFANAVRTMAYVPPHTHVRAIANAVCDSASTHAVLSTTESGEIRHLLAQLREVANESLDQAIEEIAPDAMTKAAATACDTLLQLAGVSRPGLLKHLRAVSALSVRIARDLELSTEIVERTRLGALLHDIGLLSSTIEDAETERDTGHMATGDQCLAGIEALAYVAPIVRGHHEHFDGSGGPDGLRGAEIPIESRVIIVADAFERDANRAGRTNPVAATISNLWTRSGAIYDPEIVAAVTRIFRQPRLSRRAAST
jgi:putative nucleotidyltransferase with HDIG domain